MEFAAFLEDLLWEGRVRVGKPREPGAQDMQRAEGVLVQFESHYRRDLPGEPPPLDVAAAKWAGLRLWHACQLIAFRDLGTETFASLLENPLDPPNGPSEAVSQQYSVDLVFRFLPDVHRQARSAAQQDPLVEHLDRWAQQWPLSSVGLPSLAPDVEALIVTHTCLRRLYVDRILACRAKDRLANPCVREAVREALGMYSELAPDLASELGSCPA